MQFFTKILKCLIFVNLQTHSARFLMRNKSPFGTKGSKNHESRTKRAPAISTPKEFSPSGTNCQRDGFCNTVACGLGLGLKKTNKPGIFLVPKKNEKYEKWTSERNVSPQDIERNRKLLEHHDSNEY